MTTVKRRLGKLLPLVGPAVALVPRRLDRDTRPVNYVAVRADDVGGALKDRQRCYRRTMCSRNHRARSASDDAPAAAARNMATISASSASSS